MRIQILQKKFITVLVFMLMCICALAETKTVTYTKDVLNKNVLGLNSQTYKVFSDKSTETGTNAVYCGYAAGAQSYDYITMNPMRNKGEFHYIATSSSGGTAYRVVVHWTSLTNYNTASGRYLSVYGKNTSPYTNSETKVSGTLLGNIQCDPNNLSTSVSLTISGEYKYIMIVANNLLYMDEIDIEWIMPPHTRSVAAKALGTICLPYKVAQVDIAGASFYEIAGKITADGTSTGNPISVCLNEVSELDAGIPYIFLAKDDKISLGMSGNKIPEAGNKNGLYGTFVDYPFGSDANYSDDYYIINSDNEIQRASSASGVYANRAFIKMDEVPLYEPSSSKERVLVLDENGYSFEEATDISEIISSQKENDVEIYTLGGVKINDLQRGVNIVRMSDGSVKKVLKR